MDIDGIHDDPWISMVIHGSSMHGCPWILHGWGSWELEMLMVVVDSFNIYRLSVGGSCVTQLSSICHHRSMLARVGTIIFTLFGNRLVDRKSIWEHFGTILDHLWVVSMVNNTTHQQIHFSTISGKNLSELPYWLVNLEN